MQVNRARFLLHILLCLDLRLVLSWYNSLDTPVNQARFLLHVLLSKLRVLASRVLLGLIQKITRHVFLSHVLRCLNLRLNAARVYKSTRHVFV